MSHCGHLVAKILSEYGVEVVFGMPGLQNASLYDGIQALSPKLRHVLIRDERSAGYAADAYARITGRVGVCDAFAATGSTKFVDALGEALNNSIPIVAIVGDGPRDWASLREVGVASQFIDQAGYLKPVTKAVYEVTTTVSLPHLLRSAFRTATSERPGPVAVIIPHDVLDSAWDGNEEAIAVDPRYQSIPAYRPRPNHEDIKNVATILSKIQRPAIIAGGGVLLSGAESQLHSLANALQACVVTSLTGKGAYLEDDGLSGGVICPLGPSWSEELVRAADCVIFIGTKCSQNTTINWTIPTDNQVTIHIDIDPRQLGRTFRPSYALQGDAAATIEALLEVLPMQLDRKEWISHISTAKNRKMDIGNPLKDGGIKPQTVMCELEAILKPDDIVISDASFSAGWIATYLKTKSAGRRFLFARGLGSLGYALPASIGAAFVAPKDSRIITISGDGGFCFGISELATLRQYDLKVTHIILNNSSLGWVKYLQRLSYGERYISCDTPDIDFATVAAGFGCMGETVQDPAKLKEVLRTALDSDISTVIDVRCTLWETPIRSYERRLNERGSGEELLGAKYTMRPWIQSPLSPVESNIAVPKGSK